MARVRPAANEKPRLEGGADPGSPATVVAVVMPRVRRPVVVTVVIARRPVVMAVMGRRPVIVAAVMMVVILRLGDREANA